MGVCYSTHNSADCCCDDPCCGPICDCCCDRTKLYPWGPRVLPPPILPVSVSGYPIPIGPVPGPIIVQQPAPIPPPLIPYPSTISQTLVQPAPNLITNYPPYNSPPQLPRFLSTQTQGRGSYIGSQAEQPASYPPIQRRSNDYQDQRDRRYSLRSRYGDSPRIDPRRALTPGPTSTYRPRHYRSASTSQRIPEISYQPHHHQEVFQEEENSGSSAEENRRRYTRPIHRRSASTSAQHHHHQYASEHYLSPEERIPNPPRRSFDHSSRDHIHLNSELNRSQRERSSSRQERRHDVPSGCTASNRPLTRGHGRTPSTDHLMVPERLDTLPQRKRKESLDTLRNHPISYNPPLAHNQIQNTSIPTRELKTPTPRQKALPPQQENLPKHNKENKISSSAREIKTPRPVRAELPLESREERHQRVHKLSSREVLYPTPEAAKEAFRAERAVHPPPKHRRPPTPYTSMRRTSSVRKVDSDRSIRSRVSFDSTRSRRSNRSTGSGRSFRSGVDDDFGSDDGTIGEWDPSFASTPTIGPAGEAIEVIGLGRKKPRHRTFNVGMLKPALRSTSRVNSRVDLRENMPNEGTKREKPLPSRPMSYMAPMLNSLSKVTGPSAGRKIQKRSSHQPTPSNYSNIPEQNILGASSSVTPLSRSQSRNVISRNDGSNGIRSLFSSLSLGPNSSSNSHHHEIASSHDRSSVIDDGVGIRSNTTAPFRVSRKHLILPADDLLSYLRYAEIPSWTRWPVSNGNPKRGIGIWGGKRTLGFDEMSWEWHRRLRLAEESRINGRILGSWESQRGWEKGILDWHEENVPRHPIDMGNRWGTQIFALPAEGFDTLEFFDESVNQAEDFGLLSWVTGTLLQTAVSTLHMLRYSSSTFTFHLIPSPRPPHLQQPFLIDESPSSSRGSKSHYLWEGFGTMVLVNKSNDIDRAMILEIRPPSVVDSSVMKEFARGKNGEGWWGFYGDTCVGEVGQANLLQAQVYDDCTQNQVYFFAVTNLKYWVFGQFNSNYSRCTVGLVINRQARDPSLMQCLTAWVVKSVDERPRATETYTVISPQLPTPPRETEREHRRHRSSHPHSRSRPSEIASCSDNPRTRETTSRSSFSLPPNPQGYDYPSAYPQPSSNMGSTPVYPNGTQTVFPVNMISPNEYNTSYGLPPYSDIPPQSTLSPSPYNQPNAGMMFPQHQQWGNYNINGTSRAFSPTPNSATPMPYNYGNSWYGGGGGGMLPWAGMR